MYVSYGNMPCVTSTKLFLFRPRRSLLDSVSRLILRISSPLCFQILAHCFSRKSFVFKRIRIAPGWSQNASKLRVSASIFSLPMCFHILPDSLAQIEKSTPLLSEKSRLFSQNTRVGGPQVAQTLLSVLRRRWVQT